MSSQQLSRSSSMKVGAKLMSLFSLCLLAACCLFALAELAKPSEATHINIYKHRYPFYGGYYPYYGGGYGGGFGGGINIGGFGYGRR